MWLLIFLCFLQLLQRTEGAIVIRRTELNQTAEQIISFLSLCDILDDHIRNQIVGSRSKDVPYIVHQQWKDYNISSHSPGALKNQLAILKYSPEFIYVLWSNVDKESLIKTYYPENFLSYYKSLRLEIKKADVARYLILHRFGGVYLDLDMELRKPLSDLIYRTPPESNLELLTFIVNLKNHKNNKLRYDPYAGNAFLGSVPNATVLMKMVDYIMYQYKCTEKRMDAKWWVEVLKHTGPFGLGKVVKEYLYNKTGNATIKITNFTPDAHEIIRAFDCTVIANPDEHQKASHLRHGIAGKWTEDS